MNKNFKMLFTLGITIGMFSWGQNASAQISEDNSCERDMNTISIYHYRIKRNEDSLRALRSNKANLELRIAELQQTLREINNSNRKQQISQKIKNAKMDLNRVSANISSLVIENKNALDWIGYISVGY